MFRLADYLEHGPDNNNIYANWNAYPIGKGWEGALENLSWFSSIPKFFKVDDIGKCLLFSERNPQEVEKSNRKIKKKNKNNYCLSCEEKIVDIYDQRFYFISFWHEDLVELHIRGLIKGVKPATEDEYSCWRFKELMTQMNVKKGKDNLYYFSDGTPAPYFNNFEPLNDDNSISLFEETQDWAIIPNGFIEITETGQEAINNLEKKIVLNKDILDKIEPFLNIEYYDTAIREASILLEGKLKQLNSSNAFGAVLLNQHYERLKKKFGGKNYYLLYYRNFLRTAFNFIRNVYAHNNPDTDKKKGLNLLQLFSDLYEITIELEYADSVIFNDK